MKRDRKEVLAFLDARLFAVLAKFKLARASKMRGRRKGGNHGAAAEVTAEHALTELQDSV